MAVDGGFEAAWARADATAGEPVYVPGTKAPPTPPPDGETSPRAAPRPTAAAPRAGSGPDTRRPTPTGWEPPLWTPPPSGHRAGARTPGRSDTDTEDDIGAQTQPSAPAGRPSGTTWHMSWAEAASAREAPEEPWASPPDPDPPRAVPMRVALPPPDLDEPRPKGGTKHIKVLFGLAAILLLAGGAVHAAFGSAPAGRAPAPRPAPDHVAVTRHGTSVTVTWHDPSGGAAAFRLDGGAPGVATTIHRDVGAGVTTAIVTPLDESTAWCFTVSARYAGTVATSAVTCLPR